MLKTLIVKMKMIINLQNKSKANHKKVIKMNNSLIQMPLIF